jgi:hypothetical protein
MWRWAAAGGPPKRGNGSLTVGNWAERQTPHRVRTLEQQRPGGPHVSSTTSRPLRRGAQPGRAGHLARPVGHAGRRAARGRHQRAQPRGDHTAGAGALRQRRGVRHREADPRPGLRRHHAGTGDAGAGRLRGPAGRRLQLREPVAAGLAHQRRAVDGGWRAHQQPPLQRHQPGRHAACQHDRAYRGAQGRPGPAVWHAGGRGRDQHRHPRLLR